MTVKQKYGKNEIEVMGAQDQVFAALDRWMTEVKSEEPMVEMCAYIRQVAVDRKIVGAKDLPIKTVLRILLGGGELPPQL